MVRVETLRASTAFATRRPTIEPRRLGASNQGAGIMTKDEATRIMLCEVVTLMQPERPFVPFQHGQAWGMAKAIVFSLGYDRYPAWKFDAAQSAVLTWAGKHDDEGLTRSTVQDINELAAFVKAEVRDAAHEIRSAAMRERKTVRR